MQTKFVSEQPLLTAINELVPMIAEHAEPTEIQCKPDDAVIAAQVDSAKVLLRRLGRELSFRDRVETFAPVEERASVAASAAADSPGAKRPSIQPGYWIT